MQRVPTPRDVGLGWFTTVSPRSNPRNILNISLRKSLSFLALQYFKILSIEPEETCFDCRNDDMSTRTPLEIAFRVKYLYWRYGCQLYGKYYIFQSRKISRRAASTVVKGNLQALLVDHWEFENRDRQKSVP